MQVKRMGWRAFGVLVLVMGLAGALSAGSMREEIEADWQKQAEAWAASPPGSNIIGPVTTSADAAGAVDGVKNGKYAFHTAHEPNPWWQVDLQKPVPIVRIVVYNRLDYAPGLHNADNLIILTSDDGKTWTPRYENKGRHFGGVSGARPLEVVFAPGAVRARFVRLQIPSQKPIYFHLDEVEVYGAADPKQNIALGKPVNQSSISRWSTAKRPPAQNLPPFDSVKYVVGCGRRLAADLRMMGVETGPYERELEAVRGRLKEGPSSEARRDLYLKARWTVRRLAFCNPLLNFDKLLIVKRFGQETYPDVCLNHMPWVSRPGGDICILTLRGPEEAPLVKNLLNGALGPGHVHGMDLNWDASRIVFGYAKAKSHEPPQGWRDRRESYRLRRTEEPIHIFEIGVDGRNLRQLMRGEWSDLDPTYAPNGDIVFVSERCRTSLQCNEYDKDETSCNLYVMRPDGSGIRRLSVNKDGDYLPHTLDDGTIGYTRWEYHERSWAFIQSLWSVRPNGTQADAIFKQHFVNPWALEDVRSIPDTRNQKLVCVAAGHHTLAAGPVVVVTPGVGINDPRGIRIVTPGVVPPEGGMDGAPAPEGGVWDHGGYYMHPWPLSEKTFLVSYTYGRGETGLASEVDPTGYAIYLIDVFGTKELIYRDSGISSFTPIPLRPRPRPPVLPDLTVSGTPYATCVVSTVGYGCDGIEPDRIRYIRIAEPIGWPYDNERGGQRYGEKGPKLINWTPIRILGDVPVEKDGSAKFRVPADTAVYFQILDEKRMELRRMRSFISFQPGEQRACTGCHESRTVAPVPSQHPVPIAMTREAPVPLPPLWGDRPVSFLRDIQPILDRHCVSCHSGLKPAGALDFFGGLTDWSRAYVKVWGLVPGYGFNRAFETIASKKLVDCSDPNAQDASITPPLAYGSHKSKLITCLTDAAHRGKVTLSEDDRLRLVMWIDSNAPYHDRFVNKRAEKPAYDLASDDTLLKSLAAVHERRCAACHKCEEVTRLDWIRLREPGRSLFLASPLAREAGGTGKCGQPIYRDQNDPDYQAVRALVEEAVRKAWENPRRDLQALLAERQ